MKTAISIPDSLNRDIERFLKASRMSRSEFFQRAAKLYLKEISDKAITAQLDRVHAEEDSPGDVAFRQAALAHIAGLLERDEW
jgi:hypothetical protein